MPKKLQNRVLVTVLIPTVIILLIASFAVISILRKVESESAEAFMLSMTGENAAVIQEQLNISMATAENISASILALMNQPYFDRNMANEVIKLN